MLAPVDKTPGVIDKADRKRGNVCLLIPCREAVWKVRFKLSGGLTGLSLMSGCGRMEPVESRAPALEVAIMGGSAFALRAENGFNPAADGVASPKFDQSVHPIECVRHTQFRRLDVETEYALSTHLYSVNWRGLRQAKVQENVGSQC